MTTLQTNGCCCSNWDRREQAIGESAACSIDRPEDGSVQAEQSVERRTLCQNQSDVVS